MQFKLHHILFGFLVFTLCTSLLRNGSALMNNMQFFQQLKSEYQQEKAKNDKLQLDVARSVDPYEVERIVRNKLGFVKKGEEIILIPSIGTPTPIPIETTHP